MDLPVKVASVPNNAPFCGVVAVVGLVEGEKDQRGMCVKYWYGTDRHNDDGLSKEILHLKNNTPVSECSQGLWMPLSIYRP